jgi:hypothetical protein
MSSSWYLLPNGKLLPLTTTQELLVELVPVIEDLAVAQQQLQSAIAQSAQARDEARRLIVRSRRQRLNLHVVPEDDASGEEDSEQLVEQKKPTE